MRRFRIALLAAIAAWLASQAFPAASADLDFWGTLVRFGKTSISLKLADGRLIDATLSAGTANSGYKIGDPVEITCKRIRPRWESETSRYQFLEITKIRLLAQLPANPPAESPGGKAVPAASDSAGRSELERARQVNLRYAASLPNFVADETATRYEAKNSTTNWRQADVIRTEIAFSGNSVHRLNIRRDGRRWTRPFQALPGFKWYGGFGSEIKPLFDPLCSTSIEYAGQADMRGKHLLEYRFQAPADGCFVTFYFEYQRYSPARTGHFYIDASGGRLVQFEEDAGPFPPDFEFSQRKEEVIWGDVKIGNVVHLLPVKANFEIAYSSGARWRVDVQYTNHRHFEASTDVVFP